MRITILGHASLFFETATSRVLLDPVLRTTPLLGSLVHEYPRELTLDRMPKPSLIVVSHHHFDHYDMETLRALPRDVPVMIPPDPRMERQIGDAGFHDVRTLSSWESCEHGDLRLTATPSDAPVIELGLLVESAEGRVWHMSDAEPPMDTAARILADHGPADVVTVKFQPADPQLNYQHNMGSSFDRRLVAEWLEAACAVRPKLAFPYASGLAFEDRTWLNRYAYPLSASHVADLLGRRLGDSGQALEVHPGDVVVVGDSETAVERQASPFVRQAGLPIDTAWEPFDTSRLRGLATDPDRREFAAQLDVILLGRLFADWLAEGVAGDPGRLRAFAEWGVVCQITVHMGDGERRCYHVDFRFGRPVVRAGEHVAANYFTHIGANAARRLLRGAASPLEVMIEGSVNICERIIAPRDGRLQAPKTTHIYKEFQDPLVSFGSRCKKGTA